ncbi:MAG: TMEM165/GDT1 family protein [Magnetospirillum sp.]|nr:TMEM165/GDT1 family protein [Magnetospirillum sp.]
MHAFLVTLSAVFLSEFGDKTQILAFLLSTRFRRVAPIILGLMAATGLNHLLATWLGTSIAERLGTEWLRWVLGASLLAMAAVMLMRGGSGKADVRAGGRWGPFVTTFGTYFLAEMGDKTQLATVVLAARYDSVAVVTLASTLGIMLADIPAIFLGGVLSERLNLRWVRAAAAAIFLILGITILVGSAMAL